MRKGKIKYLKSGGRVYKAQAITTKRTAITVEQQLRWHSTIDSVIEELVRLNEPRDEFKRLMDHFIGNLDESYFMSSDGEIKVIASASKKKTEKMTDDTRDSITTVRTGLCSGYQAGYYFLEKGKILERNNFKDLCKNFNAPKGSKVIMTPSAYMTDGAWLELLPHLCKSIRAMNVIKEHQHWWVLLFLDGFGLHVNVQRAHEIFAAHKILVMK